MLTATHRTHVHPRFMGVVGSSLHKRHSVAISREHGQEGHPRKKLARDHGIFSVTIFTHSAARAVAVICKKVVRSHAAEERDTNCGSHDIFLAFDQGADSLGVFCRSSFRPY